LSKTISTRCAAWKALLRNDGYWVKGVMRGHQAFAIVEREHIDAVLCDYRLPDIISEMERQHREGYLKHPVQNRGFGICENE
jgi:CheY-like chemotaxis protein